MQAKGAATFLLTTAAAVFFITCCIATGAFAAPLALQVTSARDRSKVVTIRTPEGMHRFKLRQRPLEDLVAVGAQPYKAPLLYVGVNQRTSNSRLAGASFANKLSLVFSAKNSGRIYTATLACAHPNLPCRASLRRVARSYHAKCAQRSSLSSIASPQHAALTPLAAASRELSLALHLDSEFVKKLEDGSEAEVISILNAVEVIYLNQLNVRLRITTLERISAQANQVDSANAETLLDQYSSYLARARTTERANIHHLFTGKNLFIMDAISAERLEGVVGLAFIGSTCGDSAQSVSLSQLTAAQLGVRTIITAHEIGHNLNATHPEESGLPSETAGIMSAVVKSTNSAFSQFSLNEILPFLNSSGQCLTQSAPQIEIEQASRSSAQLSVSVIADSDASANCQVKLYASSRKRMLSGQIKINRAIIIAQDLVVTPSSTQLSGPLVGRTRKARKIYLRATIECPSSSGLSRVTEVSR